MRRYCSLHLAELTAQEDAWRSFTTQGLPAARKLAFWNAIASDTFAAMEVHPRDFDGFHGSLNRERLGALTLMNVHSSAVRIRHTRDHIARMSSPSFLLLAPLRHELELTPEGRAPIRVHAGEFCLIDHARTYELRHGDAMRTLCIDLPRTRFEELLPDADELVGRLMRPSSANSRLLLALLSHLGNEIAMPGITGLTPAFGETLLSLVAATFASDVMLPTARGRQARAKLYRSYIELRLADPDLTPRDIASHFGVSERYVRQVLSADDESFTSYVLRRRLERCAKLLTDPDWAHRTITDIAFHGGFSNATHFGHAFKVRYGLTPRDFRSR